MDEASVTARNGHPIIQLDANSRVLVGVSMPPLLTGELKLLRHIGSRPGIWHSARLLSQRVLERDDPAAIQLIWKYVSTLRSKVACAPLPLIETCRRRGYCCTAEVRVVRGDAGEAELIQTTSRWHGLHLDGPG